MHTDSFENQVLIDADLISSIKQGHIQNVDESLVQPASLDLEIKPGGNIWQVNNDPPLSKGFDSKQFLDSYLLNEFSLERGPVTLTVGSLYLIELAPTLTLPKSIWGYANPKSSAGRIDLFCRLLAEGAHEYEQVPPGYAGKIYALVYPRTFPIKVWANQSMQQLRLYQGTVPFLTKQEVTAIQNQEKLVTSPDEIVINDQGIVLHLDLHTEPPNLVANRTGRILDLTSRRTENPAAFFREKALDHNGCLILDPGDFVLCRSVEFLKVPATLCMEMQAITTSFGQYSSHAAGFFDPGFGLLAKNGQPGVCEVTNIGQVPIALAHGQRICVMRVQKLPRAPERLYGEKDKEKEASHYVNNQLLAKYFTQ